VLQGKIDTQRCAAKETYCITFYLFQTSCLQDPCVIVSENSVPLSTAVSTTIKINKISILESEERTYIGLYNIITELSIYIKLV
jgi:hypothetical protein